MKKLLFVLVMVFLAGCETTEDDMLGASSDRYDLMIESARYEDGALFDEPPEDERFLVVDVTIVNNDDTTLNVNASLMFELVSEQHHRYDPDMFILQGQDIDRIDGTIGAGEEKSGALTFSVHENDSAWDLMFSPQITFGDTLDVAFDETLIES